MLETNKDCICTKATHPVQTRALIRGNTIFRIPTHAHKHVQPYRVWEDKLLVPLV